MPSKTQLDLIANLFQSNSVTSKTLKSKTTSPFRTLYNLLFFGLPRVWNIIPDIKNTYEPLRHLTWRKVLMCNNGVILIGVITKTIQCFERA
jgi:hypothetical protein